MDIEIAPGHSDDAGRYAEYRNLPGSIGAVISARLATLVELDTVLGAEDLYLLLEVLAVDNHNTRVANEKQNS